MQQTLIEKGLVPSAMLNKIDDFLDNIQALCSKLSMDLSSYQADHIAMRINDSEVAKAAHQAWLPYGQVISEAQINGRPIVVLAFNQPIKSHGWSIECLELPYPAIGKQHPVEDWEHVEFVVPSQAQTAEAFLQDLYSKFPELESQLEKAKTQGVKVKLSSPKGEGERLANPTVAFKFNNICIKLHPHSLKNIVASEQE
ncbi:VOC family protein [Vibrio hangzhouensis]|uniref:VOC family protein n=1 Tax=Vibrio hangzhouensis TaxID=462991 RepID=UPI001C93ABEB|nr:VOC family protein [Vibrio hangzhouensis]MBY6197613.1 VOC family protein [Vibrio hangzhouensis]